MWPYFVFAGLLAILASIFVSHKSFKFFGPVVFLALVAFVGLRHNVGMDWNNYLRMIYRMNENGQWVEIFTVTEPLYALLLYLGKIAGYEMYFVNTVTAVLFLGGVFYFSSRTREPWLALMAAFPFFIVVIGMSANRQALAAGLLMVVLAKWYESSVVKRSALVVFSAMAHFSALIYLGLVGAEWRAKPAQKMIAGLIFGLIMAYILLETGRAEYYNAAYGTTRDQDLESSGAIMHAALNAIPASLYFLIPQYRHILFPNRVMKLLAFAAIATVPLTAVSSIAAGRLSVYWFPVSMWVWASLPSILPKQARPFARFVICVLMIAVLWVWLELANTSFAHLPYKSMLTEPEWEWDIGVLPS